MQIFARARVYIYTSAFLNLSPTWSNWNHFKFSMVYMSIKHSHQSVIGPNLEKQASKSICCFIICMKIDAAVVFRYISPLYDYPIVCDWAKTVSKIGWKFAAFCRSHCSKLASAAAAKCGIMRVSPSPHVTSRLDYTNTQYPFIRIFLPKLPAEIGITSPWTPHNCSRNVIDNCIAELHLIWSYRFSPPTAWRILLSSWNELIIARWNIYLQSLVKGSDVSFTWSRSLFLSQTILISQDKPSVYSN